MIPSTEIHPIKALLIDDETGVRSALREMLVRHFPTVEIVGEAANIPEAVRAIHQHQPDLLFLDIEMPGYTGLQILEFFNSSEIKFDIIFVTAYNEYAIQAFKVSAFDYLLKPIHLPDLHNTLKRYSESHHQQKLEQRVALLQESLQQDDKLTRLAVSSANGIDLIQLEKIIYFEADGPYTTIHLHQKEQVVASKSIGDFEQLLEKNPQFFRAHRSYLVNLSFVNRISSKEGDIIHLVNGSQVPLSRYKKKDFETAIAAFTISRL